MIDEKNIGSSFESFLEEEGILEECTAVALKRVFAWQVTQAMETEKISKSEMARRMKTSRAHLDRFLDPENDRVQLDTLFKAASAVGKQLHMELR